MVNLDLETAQEVYNSISQIQFYKRTYAEEILLQFIIDKYGVDLIKSVVTPKKIEYEVGKWYEDVTGRILVNYQLEDNCYGFRFEKYINTPWKFPAIDLKKLGFVEATSGKVEQLLIEEAKRRYKRHTIIQSTSSQSNCRISKKTLFSIDEFYVVIGSYIENEFGTGNHILFENGKWAKVIAADVNLQINEKKDTTHLYVEPILLGSTAWIDPSKIFPSEIKTDEEIAKHHLESSKQKKGFTWEDSFNGKGYWISPCSMLKEAHKSFIDDSEINVFKTEAQAKSALAFAQLTHIVAKYNENRELSTPNEIHTIRKYGNPYILVIYSTPDIFEYFQFVFLSQEDAKTSLEVNRELWEDFL